MGVLIGKHIDLARYACIKHVHYCFGRRFKASLLIKCTERTLFKLQFSGLIILNLRSSFDKQFIHFFHLQANEIGGGNFFRIENFSETFKIVSKCSDLS